MSVVAMTAIVATLVLVPVFWESDAVVELPPIVVAEPAAVVAEPAATAVATPVGPNAFCRGVRTLRAGGTLDPIERASLPAFLPLPAI